PGLSQLYMPSFSSRTVVYKGLLLAPQVESFYDDLRNPLTESALCLVHQRFSTNTFPSWRLAHPYRFIAHNGEINTVRGNVNWMYARRRTMESDLIGADLDKMWPIIPHGQSDTACVDNALELLVNGGYSLSHAMMMLIPEAWAGNPLMDAKRKARSEEHTSALQSHRDLHSFPTRRSSDLLELLVNGGYSLSHAMMMLIPEAWAGNPLMDAKRKA